MYHKEAMHGTEMQTFAVFRFLLRGRTGHIARPILDSDDGNAVGKGNPNEYTTPTPAYTFISVRPCFQTVTYGVTPSSR
jgi:hypothetical protein